MVVLTGGALLQFLVLLFGSWPSRTLAGETDAQRDANKARRAFLSILFGAFGCCLTLYGAYRSDDAQKAAAAKAATQVAVADIRAHEAEVREKKLQQDLSNVGNGIAGLGIGLGTNQEAAMAWTCPPPRRTSDGVGPGSSPVRYKVYYYDAVELWFNVPVGRFDHAEFQHRVVPTPRAMRTLPCLRTLLAGVRRPVPQPPLIAEQPPTAPETSGSSHGNDAATWIAGLLVLGLLYAFFTRKKSS